MAGAFGRDHQHVEVGARLDQVEMDVEPVREHQRRALLHVGREIVAVDVGLQFVGRQHHHDVGPFGGARRRPCTLMPSASAFLAEAEPARSATAMSLTPLSRMLSAMGMALAAIADDGDFFALDEVEIGITIVIDAHV